MPLQSKFWAGNARLERVLAGGLAFFPGSLSNDQAAVKLIQLALVALGFPLPLSFKNGSVPDGRYGKETFDAVHGFQQRAFPKDARQWDGRVGKNTLDQMDLALLRGGSPGPTPGPLPATTSFVCGPDVTGDVATAWTRIQSEFRGRPRGDKIRLCNKLLLPVNDPVGLVKEVVDSLTPASLRNLPALLASLKGKAQAHADTNGWDLLPLFQGNSEWLRTPPVFDPKTNGPFATPSSSDPGNADPFADAHEDEATCSNTVQVAGKCWLNGSVNYGTYGIMVRECSDFAADDLIMPSFSKNPFDNSLKLNPVIRAIYSLTWATMLVRAYKKFGGHPEGAVVPIAWTEATFNGGPRGTPTIMGNRPKCNCKPGLTGSIVKWDYVWEPLKTRPSAISPDSGLLGP